MMQWGDVKDSPKSKCEKHTISIHLPALKKKGGHRHGGEE